MECMGFLLKDVRNLQDNTGCSRCNGKAAENRRAHCLFNFPIEFQPQAY